jgi:hypothetical protein
MEFSLDAVLVEQVNSIDAEPLERALGHLPDVLGSTVESTLLPVAIDLEPELGGYHHLPTEGSQCFTLHENAWIAASSRGLERGNPWVSCRLSVMILAPILGFF